MDIGTSNQPRQNSYATHTTIDREKAKPPHHEDVHAITLGQKIRPHLRKFKWLYVALAIIFSVLVVVLPVIFTVVVPKMIQDAINDAELPLLSGSVEAVSPTQVRFGLSTELHNPRSLGVALDAFPLELYNPATESDDNTTTTTTTTTTIVTLIFPAQFLTKHSTTAITVAPQTLAIHSQPELRAFLARAFQAPHQTTIGARGRTHARVLGGRYAVTLDKAVSLDGLRGLAGMKVDTLVPAAPGGDDDDDAGGLTTIALEEEEEEEHDPLLEDSSSSSSSSSSSMATINGSLTVPNPSKLTLALGDVTYRVYGGDGLLLGESHVNDLRLVPGDQAVPYEGTLDVDAIVDEEHGFAAFEKIMDTVTDDGRVPFDIVGNAAYVHGQHIEYLDEVLSQIKLRVVPCLQTTQKAIPGDKQYLEMAMLMPMDKFHICDVDAPVS